MLLRYCYFNSSVLESFKGQTGQWYNNKGCWMVGFRCLGFHSLMSQHLYSTTEFKNNTLQNENQFWPQRKLSL